MSLSVVAPVLWKTSDGGDQWIGVSFTANTGSDDPLTLSPEVAFDGEYKQHLNLLKTNLFDALDLLGVPSEQRQRVLSACPHVTIWKNLSSPQIPVTLGTSEQRSWEMAYLLSCLATAEFSPWSQGRNYWATGEMKDGTFGVADDTFDEKIRFMFNQEGMNHIFLPRAVDAEVEVPRGITLTIVKSLSQLFSDPSSPLSKQFKNPGRFSEVGRPACLQRFLAQAKYETTRSEIQKELTSVLGDQENRLILVASPIGWGKTTLIARALAEDGRPVYVTDLETVREQRMAIVKLLAGIHVSDEETLNIDFGLNYLCATLRAKLPPNTVLLFQNVSLNAQGEPAPGVMELIFALLRNDFRCVVEIWDLIDWQQRDFERSTKKITRGDISELNEEEVMDWVMTSGIEDDEIVEAFFALDGHPLGIEQTLVKVFDAKREGTSIDRDAVFEAVLSWEKEIKVSNYLSRIERDLGKELTPRIVESFALFSSRELPKTLLDYDETRQLRHGVRLGLLSETAAGFMATGWFHFFCIDKLRQTGLKNARLTISWDQLGELSPAEYEKVRYQLIETARYLSGNAAEIISFAMERPSTARESSESSHEYVAAVSKEAMTVIESTLPSSSAMIWKLEQLCRNGMNDQSAELWEVIISPDNRARLLRDFENDWTTIRSLNKAYQASSRQVPMSVVRARGVLSLLQQIQFSHAGETYSGARLAFAVADDLTQGGEIDEATQSISLGSQLISKLYRPLRNDPRYVGWCDLMFVMHRANYLRSRRSSEAREHINQVINVIQDVLACTPNSFLWQRRYFRYITELAQFAGEEEDIVFDESILKRIFETPASTLLDEFLIARLEIFESRDNPRNNLDTALIELCSTAWEEYPNRSENPETEDQFFSVCCGLMLRDRQAIEITLRALESVWTSRTDQNNSDLRAEANMRLTTIALRLARRGFGKEPKLERALGKIKMLRVRQLSEKVQDGILRLFWYALIAYRVESCKTRIRNTTREFLDNMAEPNALVRIKEEERAMTRFFETALFERPMNPDLILAFKYDFQNYAWQQDLFIKRHRKEDTRTLFPKQLEDTIAEMERRCPNYSITWRYKARFLRYVWQLENSCRAAEKAYALAHYARSRRDSLWLLGRILITWVFTPDILRNDGMPPVNEQVVLKLKAVISELTSLWPHQHDLPIFSEGIEGDAAFWEKVADRVSQRLGSPEEFWAKATDSAYLQETGDRIGDTFSDLTDTGVLSHVATALQWASQKAEFDSALRLRLAESALICVAAARNWQHGSTGRWPLPSDYKLATAISLGLKEAGNGCLLGRELSPVKSGRMRTLTWKEAARSRLNSVRSRGVGAFAEHVEKLMKQFKDYYK